MLTYRPACCVWIRKIRLKNQKSKIITTLLHLLSGHALSSRKFKNTSHCGEFSWVGWFILRLENNKIPHSDNLCFSVCFNTAILAPTPRFLFIYLRLIAIFSPLFSLLFSILFLSIFVSLLVLFQCFLKKWIYLN